MYEALLKATPEYQKIAASFAKPGPAALFGLPPAGRALLYAALQKDLGRVLCIVTPGEAEATHFADDLKALGLTAAVFPPRDFMLRPVEGAGREYEYRRLSVLGSLAGGRLNAVCVPAEALLQYTVPRDEFLKNTLTLKPGMVYNREGLVARLFAAGYVRRSQVDGPGQFSVRGDIVDIYAPDMRQPARVEYWDDEIDSMSSFDLLTQRRDGALEKIYLSPAREVLFGSTAETAEALRSAIKKARGKHRTALEKATEADLSQLDSGLPISNIVLMGIGEPLDNFDNVMRFLELVNSPDGMSMAFLTLSMVEIFHSFNMRSRKGSIFHMKHQNKYLWGAMALSFVLTSAVIYIPVLSSAFGFERISALEYDVAIGLGLLVIPAVEISKWIRRKFA